MSIEIFTMRLFLAIDLPPQAKKKLELQLTELKKEYASFNWVSFDNFHITLHFFGEVGSAEKIIKKIDNAVFDIEVFTLYSLNGDVFINHKIVLHVGFRREKTLERLVTNIKKYLQIEESHKFVPHLTIARSRIPSKQQYLHLKKKMQNLPLDLSFPVKKIYLFQTLLKSQKPVYKKIRTFSLLAPLR